MKYKCLTIAGSDGSGGAGLQADLKTFSALGCYGMSVLTALPVQNTQGVRNCYALPKDCIPEQLAVIFEDIVPDAIKIGMLFNADIIREVGTFLRQNAADIPIVLDPVMVAKSGDPLLQPDAIQSLRDELLPLATVITPNLPEAQQLQPGELAFESLAQKLLTLGPQAVLLKGGHLTSSQSDDLLLSRSGEKLWLRGDRITSNNTHGTGCTLSAAIAAGLAQGLPLSEAAQLAKRYLISALLAAKDNSVGHGHGPVHHFYHLWPTLNNL